LGVSLLGLVFLYTLGGGSGPGSRLELRQWPLSITSVKVSGETLEATVRNNQTHALQGEVDYLVIASDSAPPFYTSPVVITPPLAPGAELTVRIELQQGDDISTGLHLRVRETLAYVDEVNFELSRIAPIYTCRVERQNGVVCSEEEDPG